MIYNTLSKREKEALALIIEGLSNRDMANKMCLSLGRINYLICSLYDKYKVYEESRRVKLVLARMKELNIID